MSYSCEAHLHLISEHKQQICWPWMFDSLQFMSSFQLGNPLCELIAGFPFEMTADFFTFGYSTSIVIIFFLMCHIIVALHYVQAEEKAFSTLNETEGYTMHCSQWCVRKNQESFSFKPSSQFQLPCPYYLTGLGTFLKHDFH